VEHRHVLLTIERPVAGGEMLARHEGRVVFVRGAIPGERVLAQIVRQAKGVAWAEVREVLEPSPDRRPAPADSACGGAYFAHVSPTRQRALKAEIIADAFRRIGKHRLAEPPRVAGSEERGYRLRARLHIRDRQIGFFREGSHTLCDAGLSGQLREDSLVAVRAVVNALGRRADDCEALTLAEDIPARSRVVHLEPRPGATLEDLDGPSLIVAGVSGATASAGRRAFTLAGSPIVTDTASDLFAGDAPIGVGVQWVRHAPSFFQANRFLAGDLVRHVLSVADGEVVADLYSGVGLFGVALGARGCRVLAVEGDASSGGDLAVNAQAFADRIDVVQSSVESVVARVPPAGLDTVVVDPPRTGLTADALRGVVAWRPRRVVYVSCDPPTLARDAAALFGAGYRLHGIEAFDLFPNTPHVEAVAVFDVSAAP
jgi:23S rRNA (uracil1939-C5)-methyltransferase